MTYAVTVLMTGIGTATAVAVAIFGTTGIATAVAVRMTGCIGIGCHFKSIFESILRSIFRLNMDCEAPHHCGGCRHSSARRHCRRRRDSTGLIRLSDLADHHWVARADGKSWGLHRDLVDGSVHLLEFLGLVHLIDPTGIIDLVSFGGFLPAGVRNKNGDRGQDAEPHRVDESDQNQRE